MCVLNDDFSQYVTPGAPQPNSLRGLWTLDFGEGVCVYYYRTYYKAVRGGGRRRVDDMCYDRRRAEACVDESAHHALANAGGREIVGKKEGEQKGSARGSVHWGCYYATAVDIRT